MVPQRRTQAQTRDKRHRPEPAISTAAIKAMPAITALDDRLPHAELLGAYMRLMT